MVENTFSIFIEGWIFSFIDHPIGVRTICIDGVDTCFLGKASSLVIVAGLFSICDFTPIQAKRRGAVNAFFRAEFYGRSSRGGYLVYRS
ncbi:MAG: hypothetical protein AB3N10_07635, partial [Allomuricauda sp.]